MLLLKEKINQCNKETLEQIDKDVIRSFPESLLLRTKLNIMKKCYEKTNLIEVLRMVLWMYATYDGEVGYVQGMNLIGAAVVLHVREVNTSYIVFK